MDYDALHAPDALHISTGARVTRTACPHGKRLFEHVFTQTTWRDPSDGGASWGPMAPGPLRGGEVSNNGPKPCVAGTTPSPLYLEPFEHVRQVLKNAVAQGAANKFCSNARQVAASAGRGAGA